ncbi:MAG: DUF2156 domain-containing protein [Synergistaceae bacterium]|nr:DUF2156 domain-containing protein [Synergistaceae bacterium]MBQ9404633.1 DUF2156 domain-containing protein [Synergistaceae bacterium]MBQ9596067.1 DUF2156 domain-containing protein [Synergistaceae bacterium]
MLEFKELSWEDKDLYTKYYAASPVHYAEYSFFCLWAWRHAYPIEYAIDSRNNLIWLRSAGPLPGIFGPVGDWQHKLIDWNKAISHFEAGSIIYDVPGDLCKLLESHEKLRFTKDRDQYEYVYKVSDLISLKGKLYAQKRNRVRAFLDGYEWDYYPLTPEFFDEVREFQERWRIHRDATMTDDEAESLYDEDLAIQEALNKWEEFKLSGGIIKVDEKIIAYTIAQELDASNIDVCFEKAFGEYAGSYQAINYMFLKNNAAAYEFANREEDMGEPGLREAKMSYSPVMMLEKYQMEIL